MIIVRAAACAVALLVLMPGVAAAQQRLDKVSFGTNWVAEAEHGGHYPVSYTHLTLPTTPYV